MQRHIEVLHVTTPVHKCHPPPTPAWRSHSHAAVKLACAVPLEVARPERQRLQPTRGHRGGGGALICTGAKIVDAVTSLSERLCTSPVSLAPAVGCPSGGRAPGTEPLTGRALAQGAEAASRRALTRPLASVLYCRSGP